MTEIMLCRSPVREKFLESQCGVDFNNIFGVNGNSRSSLSPFKPYIIGSGDTEGMCSASHQRVLSQIKPVSKELTNLSLSFGEENTQALAEMTENLNAFNHWCNGGFYQYLR
ncbi:hypothetical protein [Teredinibacter haidensis]|uniref:hypothetical protein n=1 Tax=Teredinibacter haidensis TaxID=2731755 RepID=UPI000B1B917B|nr:hypothetical protein [Teredinibacter haidensis]